MTSIEVLTTTTSFSSNTVETTVETSETEVVATPTEPIANSIPAAHLVSAEVATQTQPLENETGRQSIASSSSSSSIKDSGSSFASPEKKRTRLSRVFSNGGNHASNKKLTKEEREKLQEKRSKRRSFRLSGVFSSKEEKEATANKENVVAGDNNKKRRSLSEVFNREKNVDELLRRRKRDVPPKEVEEKQRKRRSFMELFSFSDGEDEEEKREQKRKEKQQKRMSLNLAELFGFSDDESQRKSRQIQEKEDMQNLSELLNFSDNETNIHKKQISDLFHYNHEHHKSYRNEELAMNNGEDADLNTSTTISTPNSPTEEDHIIDQNRVANTTASTSQEIVREVSPSPPPTVELFKGTKIEVAATPIHTTKPPAVPVISTAAKVVFAEDTRTVSLSPISTSLRPTIATTPENNNERKSPRWSKDWKQGVKSLAIIEDNDIVQDNEHSESEVKEGKTKGSETSSDESTASTAVIMGEDTHGKPTELENTVSLTTIKSQLESQVNQQSGQFAKLSPMETVMVRQLELVERMEQTMRRLETKVSEQREEMENLYTQRMGETIQRLEAKLNVQRDELDELRGFVDDLRNPKMLLTNESTTFALSMGQNRLIQEPYHTQQTSTAQSTTIALYDPHRQPLLGTTDYSSEMESTREMPSSTTTTNATTDELAIATTSYTMPTLVSSLVVNPLYKTVGIASMVLHTIYIRPVVGLVKVVREHVI